MPTPSKGFNEFKRAINGVFLNREVQQALNELNLYKIETIPEWVKRFVCIPT